MLALHRVANETSNRVIGSVDYIKLIQEAIKCIAICPICHKKYVKGQSENGCPYCEIRCLVEDTI